MEGGQEVGEQTALKEADLRILEVCEDFQVLFELRRLVWGRRRTVAEEQWLPEEGSVRVNFVQRLLQVVSRHYLLPDLQGWRRLRRRG